MRRRLLLTHLAVAATVSALVLLAPRINIFFLGFLGSAIAWVMSGSAWDRINKTASETSVWIRRNDQESPPPSAADFPGLTESVAALKERCRADVSDLLIDRYQAGLILDNMRDGVILTDSEGLVALANPAAGAIFQRPVNEFLGRPIVYTVHSQELDQLIYKVTNEGVEAEAVIEIFLPLHRQIKATALPVFDGRELTAVLTVVQDVTGGRRLDAVRRAFVTNVSHELKTPVAGINLLAESLKTSIGGDDKAAKRFAAKLAGEAKLLSQLISDLLDLSQLEEPELSILTRPVRLQAVVKKVVSGFTESAGAKGLSLRTDLAPKLPPVSGDGDQLRLMLRNLIENAVHYTPTGGDILVTAAVDGAEINLTVADTGIGIPAKDLGRVFERFYRVDKARSRKTGGTGLGLSIVKHVVDNHLGRIELDSTVGVGSKFTIMLPLYAPLGPAAALIAGEAETSTTRK